MHTYTHTAIVASLLLDECHFEICGRKQLLNHKAVSSLCKINLGILVWWNINFLKDMTNEIIKRKVCPTPKIHDCHVFVIS